MSDRNSSVYWRDYTNRRVRKNRNHALPSEPYLCRCNTYSTRSQNEISYELDWSDNTCNVLQSSLQSDIVTAALRKVFRIRDQVYVVTRFVCLVEYSWWRWSETDLIFTVPFHSKLCPDAYGHGFYSSYHPGDRFLYAILRKGLTILQKPLSTGFACVDRVADPNNITYTVVRVCNRTYTT